MRREALTATRRQSRLGFPAHVVARWDPEVRKAHLIARRSVGVAGYVGQVKRALGYKIPPDTNEVGGLVREKLDRLDEDLRRSNRNRRDGEVLVDRTAEGMLRQLVATSRWVNNVIVCGDLLILLRICRVALFSIPRVARARMCISNHLRGWHKPAVYVYNEVSAYY